VENAPLFLRKKILCFAYGKRSDVKRQQPDVKSRRTAEESRTVVTHALIQSLTLTLFQQEVRTWTLRNTIACGLYMCGWWTV